MFFYEKEKKRSPRKMSEREKRAGMFFSSSLFRASELRRGDVRLSRAALVPFIYP